MGSNPTLPSAISYLRAALGTLQIVGCPGRTRSRDDNTNGDIKRFGIAKTGVITSPKFTVTTPAVGACSARSSTRPRQSLVPIAIMNFRRMSWISTMLVALNSQTSRPWSRHGQLLDYRQKSRNVKSSAQIAIACEHTLGPSAADQRQPIRDYSDPSSDSQTGTVAGWTQYSTRDPD